MPSVRLPDGRVVHFPYDMTPQQIEAEVSKLVPVEKPAERTWGDTLTDALPLAGGVVGGVVGAVGGIPGMMAGSAIGGGLGEAARQTARGEQLDYGDIATTAGLEGATAGAFGAAGKVGARMIRGVSRITPQALKAGAKEAAYSIPVVGPAARSMNRVITQAERASSRAKPSLPNLANAPIDELAEGYDRYMPNVSPSHAPAPPRSAPTGSKLPSGPKARGLSEGEERGIQELDQLLDAIHGADRGNPGTSYLRQPAQPQPREDFLNALMGPGQVSSGALTKAGRSMLTPEEIRRLEAALRQGSPPTRGLLPERTATNWMDYPLDRNPQYFNAAAASKPRGY